MAQSVQQPGHAAGAGARPRSLSPWEEYMTEFGVMAASQDAWATLGALESFTRDARGIVGDLGGPRLAVTVLAPNLVRVRLAPTGAFLPHRSWAVTRDDSEWPAVPFDLRESVTEITIETGQMRVRIERNP